MKTLSALLLATSLPAAAQEGARVTNVETAQRLPAIVRVIYEQFGGNRIELKDGRLTMDAFISGLPGQIPRREERPRYECATGFNGFFTAARYARGFRFSAYPTHSNAALGTVDLILGGSFTPTGTIRKTVTETADRVTIASEYSDAIPPLFLQLTTRQTAYTFYKDGNGGLRPDFTLQERDSGTLGVHGWSRTCQFSLL